MKILPINQGNKRTNFKSCLRTYLPDTAVKQSFYDGYVRTSTNMFREDMNWIDLLKYALFKFMDTDKINTYSLGASDGSEAYTFATLLMHRLSEKMYNKFFPIIAVDIDDQMINAANSRKINIHDFEFASVNRNYHINLHDYFINKKKSIQIDNDDADWTEKGKFHSYEPIDELKRAVKFKKSDVLTEINKMEDKGTSLIFCRNIFPYMSTGYRNDVISAAENKLKRGSLFILGDYDHTIEITPALEKCGFFRPLQGNFNIFQKK